MTLKLYRVLEVDKVRLRTPLQQAASSGSWAIVHTGFLAISHNGEKSENPVLWPWPMTLKFNRVRAVVKEHVPAECHQAKCSGSWVIVSGDKRKPGQKQYIRLVAGARRVTRHRTTWVNTTLPLILHSVPLGWLHCWQLQWNPSPEATHLTVVKSNKTNTYRTANNSSKIREFYCKIDTDKINKSSNHLIKKPVAIHEVKFSLDYSHGSCSY